MRLRQPALRSGAGARSPAGAGAAPGRAAWGARGERSGRAPPAFGGGEEGLKNLGLGLTSSLTADFSFPQVTLQLNHRFINSKPEIGVVGG